MIHYDSKRPLLPKPDAIPCPNEDAVHAAVVKYVTLQYGNRCRIHHSMNEGKRGWKGQQAIKMLGMSKGFPDLAIFDRQSKKALFLELKRDKGSNISPEQLSWLEWLRECGFEAFLCKGYDAAVKVIDDFMQK